MNCYLVDILYLSEAFGGARIGNFNIIPTYGTTVFAYLRTGGTSMSMIKKEGLKMKWN